MPPFCLDHLEDVGVVRVVPRGGSCAKCRSMASRSETNVRRLRVRCGPEAQLPPFRTYR